MAPEAATAREWAEAQCEEAEGALLVSADDVTPLYPFTTRSGVTQNEGNGYVVEPSQSDSAQQIVKKDLLASRVWIAERGARKQQ